MMNNMDTSDYPTEKILSRIRTWKGDDLAGLMAYIKPFWKYSDSEYWEQIGQRWYCLHTGGWSGNEEIIGALMENQIWWMMFWEQSRRGGHYIFSKLQSESFRWELPK